MVKIKSRPQTARAAKVVVVSNPKVVDSSSTGSTRNKHSALFSLVEHYDIVEKSPQKGFIMAYIYCITNKINGKQYVGKTNFSLDKRWREHCHDAKTRRCEKRPLYSAINKYGEENFEISLLEECSAEDSAKREEYWIKELNTYGHTGYNATKGGDKQNY